MHNRHAASPCSTPTDVQVVNLQALHGAVLTRRGGGVAPVLAPDKRAAHVAEALPDPCEETRDAHPAAVAAAALIFSIACYPHSPLSSAATLVEGPSHTQTIPLTLLSAPSSSSKLSTGMGPQTPSHNHATLATLALSHPPFFPFPPQGAPRHP